MSTMIAPTFRGFSPAIDPWDQVAQMWSQIRGSSEPRPRAPIAMTPDPILRIATAVRNALTPAHSYVPSVSGWHVSPEMIQSLANMDMASDQAGAQQRAQAMAEQRAQAQDDLTRQRMALEIQNEANRPTPEEQFKMQVAGHILANQYDTQKAMALEAAQAASRAALAGQTFENKKTLQGLNLQGQKEIAGIYKGGGGDDDRAKLMTTPDGRLVAIDPRTLTGKTVPIEDTRSWTDRVADWMSRKAVPMGNLLARQQTIQQKQKSSEAYERDRALGLLLTPNLETVAKDNPNIKALLLKRAGVDGANGAPAKVESYPIGTTRKLKDGRTVVYKGNDNWELQ